MSITVTTQPTGSDEPAEHDDQPRSDVFGEIWHDPGVCSNCFERITVGRDLARPRGGGDSGLDTEHISWRTPAGTNGERLEEPPATVANVHPLPRGTSACAECGSVQGLAMFTADSDLSRREALARVDTLVERVRELGHTISERHVRATVRRGKSRDEWQGQDKAIFTAAVTVGLRHG
jgi:hypothetical protein